MAQLKSLDETQKGVEKAVGKLVDAGQSKYFSPPRESGAQERLCSPATGKDRQVAWYTDGG